MRWLVDLIWLILIVLMAPVLLPRLLARGWHRTDWSGRRGIVVPCASDQSEGGGGRGGGPHILLHAVSVGEVNAVRSLVPLLCSRGCSVTVSVTTDTGIEQARRCFARVAQVVRYPLDLSWWTGRFLDSIKPDVVGFVELELWPNFTGSCARRGIPMQIIGGRLSERSMRRYRRVRWLVGRMFRRLAGVHAIDAEIASRFRKMGVGEDRVRVEGSLKWDNATVGVLPEDAQGLGAALGIDPLRPLVVVGSSAPEEHAAICWALPEGCQLLMAPRRPEWWDDAARVLEGCARRSRGECGSATGRFLLDTIGELSAAYALADVVIIGRSFARRHGSDPVEPAGMGKAVLCGPAMGDFEEALRVLRRADAIKETTLEDLPAVLSTLLADADARHAMGNRGCRAIEARQGASKAAADALMALASRQDPAAR